MRRSSEIALVVALCLGAGCAALRCHTSNGHSRGVNDNGGSYECAPVHGATTRHCVKFSTDSRPGIIIRDCDTIYQKLFGNEGMPIKEGCHSFDTVVHGVRETGTHCACRCPDNCNDGAFMNMTDSTC